MHRGAHVVQRVISFYNVSEQPLINCSVTIMDSRAAAAADSSFMGKCANRLWLITVLETLNDLLLMLIDFEEHPRIGEEHEYTLNSALKITWRRRV
jgi:hypothetical protein